MVNHLTKTRRIGVSVAVVTVVLAGALVTPATGRSGAKASESKPVRELRALWVDGYNEGMLTPAQVRSAVATAERSGANALIVQATRRQDCLCNNSNLPRATGTGAPTYDPLAYTVSQAHRRGIEVHAWVTVGKMWSNSKPPVAKNHVYNTHGPAANGANNWLDRRSDGTTHVENTSFMDLGNPAVQKHIVATVDSIQRNYKVDGINLDYIRYPDHNLARNPANDGYFNSWGYTATSLARYRAATKTAGTPAPDDPKFVAWRQDQVTGLIGQIRASMLKRDSSDRLSVNAITYGHGPGYRTTWSHTRPYAEVLQDVSLWARGGIVDTVITMNYRSAGVPGQSQHYSEWLAGMDALQRRSKRHFVSGNGLWINTVGDSIDQIDEARRRGIDWAGYSYGTMTYRDTSKTRQQQRNEVADALRAGPFSQRAAVPALPCK